MRLEYNGSTTIERSVNWLDHVSPLVMFQGLRDGDILVTIWNGKITNIINWFYPSGYRLNEAAHWLAKSCYSFNSDYEWFWSFPDLLIWSHCSFWDCFCVFFSPSVDNSF